MTEDDCSWLTLNIAGSTAVFADDKTGATADYKPNWRGVSGGHDGSIKYAALIASDHSRDNQAIIRIESVAGM